MESKHGAKMLRWSAGCALALMCVCASTQAAMGQAPAADSKAGSTKTTNSKTARPKAHVATSAKSTRTGASSASKAHPAAHPATSKHPKTTATGARSKSRYASSRKGSKRKTARGQQKIEPERAQAIQEALIREHYMSGEAAGTWNQASEDAMRRYQADHGWQSKTVPDSRALISLGLGPSHDRLLNPESAMTTEPAAPRAASLTPVSHSADAGAPMHTAPASVAPTTVAPTAAAPAPATLPAKNDSPGPQQ